MKNIELELNLFGKSLTMPGKEGIFNSFRIFVSGPIFIFGGTEIKEEMYDGLKEWGGRLQFGLFVTKSDRGWSFHLSLGIIEVDVIRQKRY